MDWPEGLKLRYGRVAHWVCDLTSQNYYFSAKQNANRLHGKAAVVTDV